MIKVSVLYPYQPNAHFDLEYYKSKHIPLIKELMGDACSSVSLDQGISGLPGQPPIYSVQLHIFSESMEVFLDAFGKHVAELDADVPNFTTLKSVVQISEVLIG
jgi:uncharacterized protein (TIGR02118 family)